VFHTWQTFNRGEEPFMVVFDLLIRNGVLDIGHERVTTFSLGDVNDAVARAAAHPGPFDLTVLLPTPLPSAGIEKED
jgi:hypothetical protein